MGTATTVLEGNATDEQLVTAVRRGDDRAFEALYARYQRRITAYVAGMVKDHGRAEDVTQEIFVSALRRMRATERPIAFKPWIYEIARNACIDQFRRTRRTEEVSFDADEGAAVAREANLVSASTPDAAMDAKQRIDDLMGAFGGLSESHHDILVMRELEGLSYREIGDRLGLSRPSVESTLFRARKRLSEEYDELVSGERCRRVGELLALGVDSLGTRDERRLARHVAHCQPCRRQAYAAGVDTATLTRHRRRDAARRVAALFPVPAFLRFSQAMSPVAEPAAGWTKALAAAAVIVAGGAGVAAHVGDDPAHAPAAPSTAQPTVVAPARSATAARPHRHAVAARAAKTRRATVPTAFTRIHAGHVAGKSHPGTLPLAKLPVRTPAAPAAPAAPAHVATPPSASAVEPDHPAKTPVYGAEAKAPSHPEAPVVGPAVDQVENATTQVNGNAGDVVGTVTKSLGL